MNIFMGLGGAVLHLFECMGGITIFVFFSALNIAPAID